MTTLPTVTSDNRLLLATHPVRAHDPFEGGFDRTSGLTFLHLPMIETVLLDAKWPKSLDQAPPEWVFFTSATAVAAFIQKFGPTRLLSSRLAVVGAKTAAALDAVGLRVGFIPEDSEASGAGHAARRFIETVVRPLGASATILWPCSARALPTLSDVLSEAGWQVNPLPLYDTRAAHLSDLQKNQLRQAWLGSIDRAVLFASPSAVFSTQAVLQDLNLSFSAFTALVIGHTTQEAVRQIHPTLSVQVARSGTLEGMLALAQSWHCDQNNRF